jgi:rhodanese-related sulfurtransferase
VEISTAVLPREITPAEVAALLARGESVRLIDVREPEEHQICRIEGAQLIPMRTIQQHLESLHDDGPPLVVFCHHGVRSLNVVNWLRRQGVKACQSMSGGIDSWSVQIDPAVARY